MRQTRLSLNNDMTRVARVFLATADCCAREFLEHEHAGLVVLDAAGPAPRRCWRSSRPASVSTRCSWSIRWATS